jgi:hypothetical protein
MARVQTFGRPLHLTVPARQRAAERPVIGELRAQLQRRAVAVRVFVDGCQRQLAIGEFTGQRNLAAPSTRRRTASA